MTISTDHYPMSELPERPRVSTMKTMHRAPIVIGAALLSLAAGTQSSRRHFDLVRTFEGITSTEEGGGARPEILYLQERVDIIYRDTMTASSLDGDSDGSFRLKQFNKSITKLKKDRTLVESGADGGVTDIRAVTDGESVYVAYEKANVNLRDGSRSNRSTTTSTFTSTWSTSGANP